MEHLLQWSRREQQRQVQRARCPNQRKVSLLLCSTPRTEDRCWPFSTVHNGTELEPVTRERIVTAQSKDQKNTKQMREETMKTSLVCGI